MGIETVTDATLARVRKGATVDDGYRAVRLLRRHGIMSIVDYIFGLEDESPQTVRRASRGLHRYDGDFVNALYNTPHSWTPLGRAQAGTERIEPDQSKWDYRHQVLAVPGLTPGQLFWRVKLVELAYHVHPRRLWRVFAAPDRGLRRQLRFAYRHISFVYWFEVIEFVRTRLFDDPQLLPGLSERRRRSVQLLQRVSRRHLDANPRLPVRHHRVTKRDHVDAPLQ
jgi:anaerobic magnesium-protoporphyrin IX monomethyl ester cyclase